MKHFDMIASGLNVAPLLAAIKPAMWREITIRQDYLGSAHADTECIFLRGPVGIVDAQNCIHSKAYPIPGGAELNIAFVDLFSAIPLNACEIGRVMLVSLKPDGRIKPHRDEGAYAERFSRFHVALQSDEGNDFECGGEHVHMLPGQCWWFDHRIEHQVANHSSRARLHLIFDARVSALYQPGAQ